MKISALFIILSSSLAFSQTVPTIGQWNVINTKGCGLSPDISYPISPGGYDAMTYIPATSIFMIYANYLTLPETSEGQDTLMQYNYAQNRCDILSGGGSGWHTDHRAPMGHQMGIQMYVPSIGSLIYNPNFSYGNDIDRHLQLYGWDVLGNTGFELPIMTNPATSPSPGYNREWYDNDELGAGVYEPVTGKMVFFPDSRTGIGEAAICGFTGMALQITCTSASASPAPGAVNIISFGMTAANNGLVYMFGGSSGANGNITTLNGSISSGATSITITSGTGISNNTYNTILAESTNTAEVVFVTAGGGTTNLTVTRGQAGTIASAHNSGATFTTASQTLYTFNPVTPGSPWAQPVTSCNVGTSPDCSGNGPTARFNPGITYDPDDGTSGSIIMAGGTQAPQGSGILIQDTWQLDLASMAWIELCGPNLNASNCSNFGQYIPLPGSRLAYDNVDHIITWMNGSVATNTTSLVSGSISVYPIGTITPLAYGRSAYSGLATSGSLNVTTPSSITTNNIQGNATDPALSTDGTNIYLAHSEDAPPESLSGKCQVPQPYVDSITFSGSTAIATGFPTGSLITRCTAIGGNGVQVTTGGLPFAASVAGVKWEVNARQNINNIWGETNSINHAQAFNSSTNTWQVPYFPPKTANAVDFSCAATFGGSNTCGTVGSNILTFTSGSYPLGATTSTVLLIQNGTGTPETAPVTAVNNGAFQLTITTAKTHSGAFTVQDTGWMGCFTSVIDNCVYLNAKTNINQYTQGLIAVGNNPTIAVLEQTRAVSTNPETYLYLTQPSGLNCGNSGTSPCPFISLTGSTPLNINTIGSGTSVKSASCATDGGGINIACTWSEEVNNPTNQTIMLTTPQIQVGEWNGTTFNRLGSSSLNQAATNWGYTPSIASYKGQWYVAYIDRPITGWPNLYVKVWNGSTWNLVGSGSLNDNTSTGIAFHPSLTTDGTNLYLAWEEQSAIGSRTLGFLNSTTGASWNSIATNIAASPSLGSVENISVVAMAGKVTVSWAELAIGNLRQIYAQQFTAGSTGGSAGTVFQLDGGTLQ